MWSHFTAQYRTTITINRPSNMSSADSLTPTQIRRRIIDYDAQIRLGLEDGDIRLVVKRIGSALVSRSRFSFFFTLNIFPRLNYYNFVRREHPIRRLLSQGSSSCSNLSRNGTRPGTTPTSLTPNWSCSRRLTSRQGKPRLRPRLGLPSLMLPNPPSIANLPPRLPSHHSLRCHLLWRPSSLTSPPVRQVRRVRIRWRHPVLCLPLFRSRRRPPVLCRRLLRPSIVLWRQARRRRQGR